MSDSRRTTTVGLYVGGASSFNVRNDVRNIGWMLSDAFDLHLVTTRDLYESDPFDEHFTVHGTGYRPGPVGDRRALLSFLGDTDPDVLFNVTHPPVHGTELGVTATLGDARFVFRYPGDNYNVYRARRAWRRPCDFLLNNCLGRLPLRLADWGIVMGPCGETRLVERGFSADRISELPPPVDGERFRGDPTESLDVRIPGDRSVVLFAGRLTRLKGIEVLERTIPRILECRPDLQFLFVGEGPRSLAVPARYDDHVSVVGGVPPVEVPKYFKRADLLVLPSLVEAFGRVLVEALFSDTTVIARRIGNTPTITDNTFGSESAFVEMVCSFESLPTDDPGAFDRTTLKPEYVETFRTVATE